MGAAAIPVIIITVFWGVIGIVIPFFIPRGPNKGIFQVVMLLTAACCWLFWLCCYMAQMNPLIGPKLSDHAVYLIARQWSGYIP